MQLIVAGLGVALHIVLCIILYCVVVHVVLICVYCFTAFGLVYIESENLKSYLACGSCMITTRPV